MNLMIKRFLKSIVQKFNFSLPLTINNQTFTIPITNGTGALVVKHKEAWMENLLSSFESGSSDSFIDVGVNLGQTLLLFRSFHTATYYGFEPNSHCLSYTENLINVNSIKNAHLMPVGLSDTTEIKQLFRNNNQDPAASLLNDLRNDYYSSEYTLNVPVFAFDELPFWKELTIPLVKIDVEGAETFVIAGMQKFLTEKQPLIICEVLDTDNLDSIPRRQKATNEMVESLKKISYTVYCLCHPTDKIELKQLDTIEIKKWTPESTSTNDFLFVPKGYDIENLQEKIR